MYGSWIFGSHDEAVRQSQIATSQVVFTAAAIAFNSLHSQQGTLRSRYEYGTHEATVMQSQIANASQLFKAFAPFPQQPILGLKRDFPISQEEQPLDAPSSFWTRSVYLASAASQNPVVRPALQSFPQESQEQFWSFVYKQRPQSSGIIQNPSPTRFLQSIPQEAIPWDVSYASTVIEPIGAPGPVSVSLVPPTILGLEDPGVDPTTLLGKAQLRWAAVPGASAYRVYINGVPQNPPILGQSFLATGLVVGQQYKFAVVAVAQGIDDSPLSNEIYYEHGSNEFSIVFKYPWGNTFKQGYVLVVKLGTPV